MIFYLHSCHCRWHYFIVLWLSNTKKANAKNVQISVQLHSFHMPASLCSKSFNLGFSSMCTKKFQMYKLCLEKAEEPDIKLPTFVRSQRKQGN